MIEMIALTVDDNVCQTDNMIPLVLEAHLEKFREVIKGKPILMGRKAFESLDEKTFTLASDTYVLSRTERNYPRNITPISSLIEILLLRKDIVVIGGCSLFYDFISIVDKIYLTEVAEVPEGDYFKTFPALDNFNLDNPETELLEENGHYYRLLEYSR